LGTALLSTKPTIIAREITVPRRRGLKRHRRRCRQP
jgi:hypothetical protein